MSFDVFSPPKPPPVQPLPDPPKREDPAVDEARRKELVAARKAKGRASTLLTGGQGVQAAAPVQRRSLLAG